MRDIEGLIKSRRHLLYHEVSDAVVAVAPQFGLWCLCKLHYSHQVPRALTSHPLSVQHKYSRGFFSFDLQDHDRIMMAGPLAAHTV